MTEPDNQHPDYTDYLPVWQKCRDATAGQRAIKAGRFLYLKPLTGQETKPSSTPGLYSEYDVYLDRANYFNATGRTVEAMTGMAFRMPMTVEVPAGIDPWLEDITLSDETLTDFAQSLMNETIITGRCGILVEQPKAPEHTQTVAEKQASGSRPYMVLYKTESIINWQYQRLTNRYRLFNLWLSESFMDENGETIPQIRQLTLQAGYYQQIIWQKPKDTSDWIAVETVTPVKGNAQIDEIPFFPITPQKPTLAVTVPPIESLADINIAHYKNSADLENGVHLSGLPTPYITGVDDKDEQGNRVPIYLGSRTILALPEGATAGFLQCGTEGFASLEKAMDRKEQQMAALGARMLAPEKKQAEAANTHEIKRGGENSVLSAVCGMVERQITRALEFAAAWEGIAGEIDIEINRDFFPPTFTGVDALNWMKVWQASGISKEYLFNIYKYGEWLPAESTFEEMQAQIEAEPPPLGMITDDQATANDNGDL